MRTPLVAMLMGAVVALAVSTASAQERPGFDLSQVPTWSHEDLEFFLHGSMTTEVVPERVLKAFMTTYPDLFHGNDLSTFGLLPDVLGGWPVGVSRREVPHLANLPSIGINCAACHVGEITFGAAANPVRVLGMTSHFDSEAFFSAVVVSTFRTADAVNMKRYLVNYLAESDPQGGTNAQDLLEDEMQRQDDKIAAAVAADPFGAKGVAAGGLYRIAPGDMRLDTQLLERHRDLTPLVRAQLKLFHNMRAALHVPDQPPDTVPPAPGLGRNGAFGLLSAVLFGTPQPFAPVKYGLVWNLEHQRWLHWDANTQSPIARNLLASLGLGAPLIGKHVDLNYKFVKRLTDLGQMIRAPRYLLVIDADAAQAGARHYQARCASCHDIPDDDTRLYNVDDVGTDPRRALQFTPRQAELFDTFLAELKVDGYKPSPVPPIRSTQKYWAPSLAGVWARSPYLHDGSVRTMTELLTPPKDRAKTFHRGSHEYDSAQMGYTDAGEYLFDTSVPGNANTGHNYGTDLSDTEKRELIEYLKTL